MVTVTFAIRTKENTEHLFTEQFDSYNDVSKSFRWVDEQCYHLALENHLDYDFGYIKEIKDVV